MVLINKFVGGDFWFLTDAYQYDEIAGVDGINEIMKEYKAEGYTFFCAKITTTSGSQLSFWTALKK